MFQVERLFAQIAGARLVDDGLWAIPCETVVPMTFTFGQQTYTLEPTDYLIGPASGNPKTCLTWPRALPPSADGIDWQFGMNSGVILLLHIKYSQVALFYAPSTLSSVTESTQKKLRGLDSIP